MQYGALFGNERDGGGYVPTSNGSSSGELMYFAVPYQSGGEQEIRIVSWDNANTVKLDRFVNGKLGAGTNLLSQSVSRGRLGGKDQWKRFLSYRISGYLFRRKKSLCL